VRRILGSKRDALIEGWRKLRNEKLTNLRSSPNITGMIKTQRMRRTGHVAVMGEIKSAYRVL
jgi:hypothetical protein